MVRSSIVRMDTHQYRFFTLSIMIKTILNICTHRNLELQLQALTRS